MRLSTVEERLNELENELGNFSISCNDAFQNMEVQFNAQIELLNSKIAEQQDKIQLLLTLIPTSSSPIQVPIQVPIPIQMPIQMPIPIQSNFKKIPTTGSKIIVHEDLINIPLAEILRVIHCVDENIRKYKSLNKDPNAINIMKHNLSLLEHQKKLLSV